ncbi:hypothetical protein ALC57_03964 [Trachymyrmex cornetzi]|uniref:Uncharacterized protein n=1 Tax=Trachymyrmex cornetzi TaxID=471704 RepID=A0A151JLG8_9HYME|nr:hypothetical protein ALC57_03964 [Trachymyrmex cornetzi]
MAEQVIDYVLNLKRPLFLFVDATGSIIKNNFDIIDKRIFVYAAVVAGSTDYSPLDVTSFISSKHGVKDVSIFAEYLADTMRRLSTKKVVVDKIETDFSLVLMQSFCRAFNGCKLSIYLNQTFKEIHGKNTKTCLVVLHVCSSHLIKTIKKQIDSHIADEDAKKLALNAINQLIHSTSLEETAKIVEGLYVLFGCEYRHANFAIYCNYLKNQTNETEEINACDAEIRCKISEKDVHDDTKKESPFYEYFQTIKNDCDRKGGFSENQNIFYTPKFMNYVFDFLLPYYSTWSGAMLKQFNMLRDSNAPVENYWKIEKQYILNNRKNIQLERYIKIKEEITMQRLRERKFSLQTTRVLKKRKEANNENHKELFPEGTWKKKET